MYFEGVTKKWLISCFSPFNTTTRSTGSYTCHLAEVTCSEKCKIDNSSPMKTWVHMMWICEESMQLFEWFTRQKSLNEEP